MHIRFEAAFGLRGLFFGLSDLDRGDFNGKRNVEHGTFAHH
jgi:hypothetical protein